MREPSESNGLADAGQDALLRRLRRLERFRALLDQGNEAIFLLHGPTRLLSDVNASACRQLGYEREDLLALSPDRLFPPALAELLDALLADERAVNAPASTISTSLRKASGEEFPAEVTVRVVTLRHQPLIGEAARDVGASPEVYAILVARDIGVRQEMELALRASTEKMRAMFKSLTDGITFTDLQGNVVEMNEASARLHGFDDVASAVGRNAFDFIAESDRARAFKVLEKTFSRGHSGTVQYRMLRRDGSSFDGEISATLLKDAYGEPSGFVAITRDITERKQAELRLRESEERYKNIVEMSPDGIITLDLKGVVTSCNTAFLELSGFPRETIVGHHFTTLPTLRLRDAPQYARLFFTFLRGQKSGPVEFRWFSQDGVPRWGEARVSLMKKGGRLTALQAVVRDITEQKRGLQLLRLLNELALAVARALTPDEIFAAVTQTLEAQNFSCVIFLTDAEQTHLLPRHLMYAPAALKTAERLVGIEIDAFAIPIADVEIFRRVVVGHETVFLEDPWVVASQLLPRSRHHVLREALNILHIPQSIIAPLIVEEGVIGALAVESDELRASDVPAITALVHQVALALRKAQLYEQAQQEIAERQRTELALRESEEALRASRQMLQLVLDNIPQAVFWKDRDAIYLGCNLRFASDVGLASPEEIVGKSDFDLHDPEPAARFRADDFAVLESGLPKLDYEEAQRFASGEVGWLRTSKVPIRDANGEVMAVMGVYEDITERRLAQEEIMRLQAILQGVADSMPSVLITLNSEARVLTWNPAAEALTGQSAEQARGRSLWEIWPPWARYREMFEQVLAQGEVRQRLKQPQAGAAGTAYCDISMFPLATDEVQGAVLRVDDVTRRVQIEQAMLQSAKMASVGGLAAGVAHEINNPLAAMMQAAQMLQILLDLEREQTQARLRACGVDIEGLARYLEQHGVAEYVEGVRSAGQRAAKIVTDLLAFSRTSASEPYPQDFNALVEKTLDLAAADYDLELRYDFREIDVVRELTPGLPDVVCDASQIQQVVLNLVHNATQAMARRKRQEPAYQPQLTLRTSWQDGHVRLEVENNGPSIPQDVHERLFEPFFTTKEVGEGTGLGLWICWSIVVERHYGRIWAESLEETGVRFVVDLPVG